MHSNSTEQQVIAEERTVQCDNFVAEIFAGEEKIAYGFELFLWQVSRRLLAHDFRANLVVKLRVHNCVQGELDRFTRIGAAIPLQLGGGWELKQTIGAAALKSSPNTMI